MLKTALGILTGILIFIAAGLLATYWIGKMRRDMDDKKPRSLGAFRSRDLKYLE